MDMTNLAIGFVLKSCSFGNKFHPLRRAVNICSTQVRCKQTCSPREPACTSLLTNTNTLQNQRRHFLPGFSNPFSGKSSKLVYTEHTLLGYSMEQMFEVVADVEAYPEFVPWCKESLVTHRTGDVFRCRLTVGFPPVVERYTSIVTTSKPHMVRSECFDGVLFNHLLSIWKFDRGPHDNPNTCMLDFFVEFEFRNSLHSHLAHMFFNEVARTMVSAFLKRARKLHGPPSVRAPKGKKTVNYTP